MAAYLIAGVNSVSDPDTYAAYQQRAIPTLAPHGGRIVAGTASERIEGNWRPAVSLIVEFPSMAALRAWYDGEDYRPLRAIRQAAADVDIVFVEGN